LPIYFSLYFSLHLRLAVLEHHNLFAIIEKLLLLIVVQNTISHCLA
jgi:hypothetical protein